MRVDCRGDLQFQLEFVSLRDTNIERDLVKIRYQMMRSIFLSCNFETNLVHRSLNVMTVFRNSLNKYDER